MNDEQSASLFSRIHLGEQRDKVFTSEVQLVPDAIVIPKTGERGGKYEWGVLYADLSYCDIASAGIKREVPPRILDKAGLGSLEGRHIFGGYIRAHFGHFLLESLTRLWAFPALRNEIDGIVFTPFLPSLDLDGVLRTVRGYLHTFKIDCPIRIVSQPTVVEELYVPERGFGWRERFRGSEMFHGFVHQALQDIPAKGGKRLYISRSKLPLSKGGVLGEKFIEDNLRNQGYDVFHPQEHSLEAQISRYKAAEKIVALDGSALHLVGFSVGKNCQTAIIQRRSNLPTKELVDQFAGFLGSSPLFINCVKREWTSRSRKRANAGSLAELDFDRVFKKLRRRGFCEKTFIPRLPGEEEITEQFELAKVSRKGDLQEIEG